MTRIKYLHMRLNFVVSTVFFLFKFQWLTVCCSINQLVFIVEPDWVLCEVWNEQYWFWFSQSAWLHRAMKKLAVFGFGLLLHFVFWFHLLLTFIHCLSQSKCCWLPAVAVWHLYLVFRKCQYKEFRLIVVCFIASCLMFAGSYRWSVDYKPVNEQIDNYLILQGTTLTGRMMK